MPDNAVEPAPQGDYPSDMATRVAILEALAERSDRTQQAVLAELRDLRLGMAAQLGELHMPWKSRDTTCEPPWRPRDTTFEPPWRPRDTNSAPP